MSAAARALQDHFGGAVHVPADLQRLHQAYRAARPFPHLVLDDLFDPALLERLDAGYRDMAQEQWQMFEQDGLERTYRMRSALDVGPGREMVALMHSAAFLYLLSEITGIWQLLPDPYLQGGGHAMMRHGDYFQVHSDRTVAYDTGLTRRLAAIVFLNKEWRPEYHGQLELWNHEGTRCEVSVEPEFNRTIVFEVAYPNYHGVPEPLACPETLARRSFLVYYHTVGVGAGDTVTPHSSRFAPQCYRRNSLWRRTAVQLTPPIVLSSLRRLRRGKS